VVRGAPSPTRTGDLRIRSRFLLSSDSPSFLKPYKSEAYRPQIGITWVDLGYCGFPRLHFSYTFTTKVFEKQDRVSACGYEEEKGNSEKGDLDKESKNNQGDKKA
jgi:hypothetical protein